jgi:hypothetical protein
MSVSSRAAKTESERIDEYTVDAYEMAFRLAIEGTPEGALVMIADDYTVWAKSARRVQNFATEAMCERRIDSLYDEIDRQHRASSAAPQTDESR